MENSYEIVFDKDSSKAAIECLMNMVELERTPKFGSLKNEYAKTNRYKIEENNVIDSRYYTDKSTTLLFYAIELYSGAGAWFCENILDLEEKFWWESEHDFNDNSLNPEKNDISIIENEEIDIDDFSRMYAFYSGFELLNQTEEEGLIKTLEFGLSDVDYDAVLKKTEVINGVEKSFYYLSSGSFDTANQIANHQSYVNYIEERFSSDILKALSEYAYGNDVIIASPGCCKSMEAAAYANSYEGHVVINSRYYEDSICHEIGHIFDRCVSFAPFYFDIHPFNIGLWDSLANKYADDVATIRRDADISCGYSAEDMEEQHREFYAEAFQLYFYSPETRAALPEKIRKTIEYEINRFTGDGK